MALIRKKDVRTKKIFTLKGMTSDGYERYIQTQCTGSDPIIVTRLAYRSYGLVAFETKSDARVFLDNFLSSDRRRLSSNISWTSWRIAEFKPMNCGYYYDYNGNHELMFEEINTSYGRCLRRIS